MKAKCTLTALGAIFILGASWGLPASAQQGVGNDFAIEGDLLANSPAVAPYSTADDWLPGPMGPGSGVLNADGTPVDPTTTFFREDLIRNADANGFFQGNKVADDPTTYIWSAHSSPRKDDIQYGLIHTMVDDIGDLWVAMAGDRQATNGTSYIDFEFLQNSLFAVPGSPGTFTSEGPDGGRTVGDILLTIRLVRGGAQATFFAQKWQEEPPGSGLYTYVDFTPDPGDAFVAANVDSEVVATFRTPLLYEINQFGEAVANLSEIIGALDCFGIKTVFIRTKSSASAQAELKDFIEPIQLLICLDRTAPVLAGCPLPEISVECDAVPPAAVVTATDECDTDVSVTFNEEIIPGPCPDTYTIVRTWTATDECDNTASCSQTIHVADTTAPMLSGCPDPGPLTIECSDPVPDPATVTATDNCDDDVPVMFNEEITPGSCPDEYTITRTWTATDDCLNSTSCSQTINVVDTTPPVLSGCPDPGPLTIECSDPVPDPATVTATDNCDDDVPVAFNEEITPGSCPDAYTIVRTWTAVDDCGNAAEPCTQTINVVDTTAPVLAGCPDDTTVECDAVPDPATVTATDNCDDDVPVSFNEEITPGSCPDAYTITRTWTAVDDCGNAAEPCVQTINVVDTTPPVLSGCPDDITVECSDPVPDPATVTATDNCDDDVPVQFSENVTPGDCPHEYAITRRWTATDDCGNAAEPCVQTINVVDTTAPELAGCPDDVTVECDAVPGPATVTATDNCDDDVPVAFNEEITPGSCPDEYTITRTWTAVDDCGNAAEPCVQTINVVDTTPPTIACPPDETIECDVTPVCGDPEASDNCDPDPAIILVSRETVPGQIPGTEITTCTWEAQDRCGNVSERCSQRITRVCPVEFCSLTQGFYGNYGGEFNGTGTLALIQSLIGGSPLVVGWPGRSVTIPLAAAECIIVRLPGGTTPEVLPDIGDDTLAWDTCQTAPPLPLYDGDRFENVFLAQVITLSLNVRLDTNLPGLELDERICTTAGVFAIPPAVLSALTDLGLPQTVGGLLELANRGLGNQTTGGASIAEINFAVDSINRAFDHCQSTMPCGLASAAPSGSAIAGKNFAAAPGGASGVGTPIEFDLGDSDPNPFNPSTNIRLALPEATSWTLSIYNVAGKMVRRFDGRVDGPAYVDVNWDGRNDSGQPVTTGVYIYRVVAGKFSATKKAILLK